jgi:hypothetical protein
MMDEPTVDPMAVLTLTRSAAQLAAYLRAELAGAGLEALDDIAVLDGLEYLGLTMRASDAHDQDVLIAAYLTADGDLRDLEDLE